MTDRSPVTAAGGRPRLKLAIVGSTELVGNQQALAIIENVLDRYQPTLVISGGAEGIDKMAVAAARARGIECEEKLPKVKNWEHGFKPRNIEIATACDQLVRIAKRGSKTYGSGWTRDYAANLGKFTEEFVI